MKEFKHHDFKFVVRTFFASNYFAIISSTNKKI